MISLHELYLILLRWPKSKRRTHFVAFFSENKLKIRVSGYLHQQFQVLYVINTTFAVFLLSGSQGIRRAKKSTSSNSTMGNVKMTVFLLLIVFSEKGGRMERGGTSSFSLSPVQKMGHKTIEKRIL